MPEITVKPTRTDALSEETPTAEIVRVVRRHATYTGSAVLKDATELMINRLVNLESKGKP